MLLAPLLALLAGPPAPAEAACQDPGAAPDAPLVTLGPAAARTEVEAFLDPASPQSWRALIELRRLVADHQGELRVELSLAGRGGSRDPHVERVRAMVTALATRGHLERALRVVTRDGVERMHARLVDPSSHAALAEELGVPVAMVKRALRDRCARERLAERTRTLFETFGLESGAVARLPAFVVAGQTFDDTHTLERLRPELGRLGQRLRTYEAPPPMGPPPPLEATSERMQRPPLPGVLLGGPGLPHRFVLMARDEDDPSLALMLPPVLRSRHDHPAFLAVHVVARGVSAGAELLRHRLCAARRLGLQSAYVGYLGRSAMLRQGPDPAADRLLEALDGVPAKRCRDELDPVQLDLPDGAWLDGLPRSRQELETLDATLRLLDAAWRPLDPLLPPSPQEP